MTVFITLNIKLYIMPFVKNIMCQYFNEFFKYKIKFKFYNIYK